MILGFFGLLITMRLLGKKALSELTPFDIVYVVVFGGILEESLYDNNIQVWHMLFGVLIWGACIYLIELATRKFAFPRRLMKGELSVLINNGEFDEKELKKNKMEMEQIRTMLRQENIYNIEQVKYLIVEPGGQISIKKYEQYEPPEKRELGIEVQEEKLNYLLINEGKVNKNELKRLGKEESWLYEQLGKIGYSANEIASIIYGEWDEEKGFWIKRYKGMEH
ncbi:DUF421 domain-containing protein [Listeria sp. FSL L7-0091]|uniref:DUF421 domain-containing protein n=2 Tax=Listeria farberi TaxID=2713500 RepID=A0A7X0ZJG8_9LIST|nr:DUF421 domain-containing protein [Listeria farberi]MBC1375689.1 DUF421 domain-containing protein [Listeria farberi]MBC1382291.1 DUF421 domain-containing protein [Listeria farberi]MBC2261644.1 DUF421 domain-containing protein [Listeria farberi]MBC2268816.1 DUF421 domain-containing protein [Listeria farberi]MBC2287729.1 DUF421 domain-containing protein [Listeria farberi]